MQDRISQIDEIFLQRTAGPYIWVKSSKAQSEHITSAVASIPDIHRLEAKDCDRQYTTREQMRFPSDYFLIVSPFWPAIKDGADEQPLARRSFLGKQSQ
jgi:hypothetical protein